MPKTPSKNKINEMNKKSNNIIFFFNSNKNGKRTGLNRWPSESQPDALPTKLLLPLPLVGFEPTTSRLKADCSTRSSSRGAYFCKIMTNSFNGLFKVLINEFGVSNLINSNWAFFQFLTKNDLS